MSYQHYYDFMMGPVTKKLKNAVTAHSLLICLKFFNDELVMQICHRFVIFVVYPLRHNKIRQDMDMDPFVTICSSC